jgi:hypothetical protein
MKRFWRARFAKASLCLLAAGACASLAWPGRADEPARTVPLAQVPAPARKTIQEEAGRAALGEIESGEEDGRKVFTAHFTAEGHERQLTVAEDGTLLSKEVTLEQTPPPVRNTIQGQLKGAALVCIDKTYDETDIYFEATVTNKGGTERSFTVGLDGKLLSTEISIDEVPAAVRKTIETSISVGHLESISRMVEEDETSYYVEFSRDGQERDLSVGEDGKLQNMEVFLPELSAAVQKTIKEKLAGGTVVRIDKSFEAREGGFPYEIEGRKDGKPFNFSVSPRGKFLGMDE